MVNLPKISNDNDQKSLDIERKGNLFIYTRVFNPEDLKVYDLPLKKAAFLSLSTLKYRLANLLAGKKVVVLRLRDPTSNTKLTKCLARLDDIVAVSNLSANEIKVLKKQGELETKLSNLNYEAVDRFAKKVLNTDEIKNQSLKNQLQKLQSFDKESLNLLEALGKKINKHTKVNEELFVKLLKENFKENRFIKEYNLTQEEFDQIDRLQPFVPFQNIEKLLKSTSDAVESRRILNTLFRAAEILKDGVPKENIYRKKTTTSLDGKKEIQSYSFTITKNGELIIATKFLAKGSFKKVSQAINLSNAEQMVKLVVRGEVYVNSLIEEENIRENLYNSNNPYIVKPCKIHVLTRTNYDDETNPSPFERVKYVFFEKRMEDGKSILPKNIYGIAQFCHDYAKGLDILHNGNPKYVHSDVKPANGLVKGGRGFVTDFGLTRKIGEELIGGTAFYLPPEYLDVSGKRVVGIKDVKDLPNLNPALDSYSLGMTIFCMLDPSFEDQDHYGFLTENERNDRKNKLMEKFPESEFTKNEREHVQKLIQLADKLSNNKDADRMTCGEFAIEVANLFPDIDVSDPS